MKVIKVKDRLKIGKNTSVIIDDNGKELKNGMGVLDADGNPYVILSIGMNSIKGSMDTTTLLLEGDFDSDKIFV